MADDTKPTPDSRVWPRRDFLNVTATAALGSQVVPAALAACAPDSVQAVPVLRWGVVGTGNIANSMAGQIKAAETGELAAVSSRRMETAQAFADRHGVANAFDSWADMIASDVVDAIYVATPTSVREEISVAAANGGRHVLGEKPFASLASVQRIVGACRANDVAFMDGTHFPHHPRTSDIQDRRGELLGRTWSVASAFQFNLVNRSNIRYNPELEPMGAIGDAGWYNMRAAVEYLPPDVELQDVSVYLRRDDETGSVSGGSGVLSFAGGETSTWNCGFDSGSMIMDVRISGTSGVIHMDDFLYQNPDNTADFDLYRGRSPTTMTVASTKPGAQLMFEDMASAAADPTLRDRWMTATERTQSLLDAVWAAGLESEG